MAISSRLVELMRGRIWLKSQEGQGSTFHFTARFGIPEQQELVPPPRRAMRELHGLRVLIVDDNATNCAILEEILSNWSMQPTSVTRSEEALPLMRHQLAAGHPFDLVLLDTNMPEIDGFAVAEAILADRRLGSAVTMMLTSSPATTSGVANRSGWRPTWSSRSSNRNCSTPWPVPWVCQSTN